VDSCNAVFHTPKQRRRHLIDKHRYPTSFNFAFHLPKDQKIRQRKQIDEGKCKQVHDADHESGNSKQGHEEEESDRRNLGNEMDALHDMDVEQLASEMQSKLRVRIPKKISFGRGRGR
jgi:hypothetical protein